MYIGKHVKSEYSHLKHLGGGGIVEKAKKEKKRKIVEFKT